jgi:homoserine dehydrogenase
MKPIQVGLLGIGTVGSGTFKVLQRNQERSAAAPAAASRSRWWPT